VCRISRFCCSFLPRHLPAAARKIAVTILCACF
jgi:hypothetical protein